MCDDPDYEVTSQQSESMYKNKMKIERIGMLLVGFVIGFIISNILFAWW